MLAIALIMASFQISAQEECDCNTNPKVYTKQIIQIQRPSMNKEYFTYTVKYYDCGGKIRIYDIIFTTSNGQGNLIYANALQYFIADNPGIARIQFQAECARFEPKGGQIGSGESGSPVTFGLIFCTEENSTCCEMSTSQFDYGQFLSMQPKCPNPNFQNCLLICQP